VCFSASDPSKLSDRFDICKDAFSRHFLTLVCVCEHVLMPQKVVVPSDIEVLPLAPSDVEMGTVRVWLFTQIMFLTERGLREYFH